MQPEELVRALAVIKEWRKQYPLMTLVDRATDQLPGLLGAEVEEAWLAHEALETAPKFSQAQNLEWGKETTDVLVFLYALLQQHGISLDLQQVFNHVNGQYRKSSVYDYLVELAVNVQEGDIKANIQEMLTVLMSLFGSLPIGMRLEVLARLTIIKNARNRPLGYYQIATAEYATVEPSDKGLSQPNRWLAQYHHVETALRLLRDVAEAHGHQSLPPEFHLPFAHLIMDFTNSAQSLAALRVAALGFDFSQLPVVQTNDR